MFFKKTSYDWVNIVLWICVAIALIMLGFALWYGYLYGSIAMLIILLALLLLLGYCKYVQVMGIRRKFVVVQESFTTMMLIYFSYAYFSGSQTLPGEKALNDTRKKFDAVYEKSRYQLTMPLVMTALKTFGEIKNIKNIIMSEVKNFSSFDGFNLDNAESITKEIGNLTQKLGQLSDIVSRGFSSKKSMKDILEDDPKPRPKPPRIEGPKKKKRPAPDKK